MTMIDAGPIPDSLKRQPPQSECTLVVSDAVHLATDVIVKTINDEYAVILGSERANLPRALKIAEKLDALRARTIRGQWKTNFASFGLNISYETASVYLRVWENWADIKLLAAAKSADPALLTIDGALKLWANRNKPATSDSDEDEDDGKPTAEAMLAKQSANAEEEAAEMEDVDIDGERRERVDRTFATLIRTRPLDELTELTERLAKHLGMKLTPLSLTDRAIEAGKGLDGAAATNRPPTSTVGFEKRI